MGNLNCPYTLSRRRKDRKEKTLRSWRLCESFPFINLRTPVRSADRLNVSYPDSSADCADGCVLRLQVQPLAHRQAGFLPGQQAPGLAKIQAQPAALHHGAGPIRQGQDRVGM